MKNAQKLRPLAAQGYIALIAVLIIGAACIATSVALLTSGTDSQRGALALQQSMQARQLAQGCAEEALQQIQSSTSFTGTNSLTLGQGTCTYTVTNTGTSTRTIDTSGTVGGVVRKVKVYATIGGSSISITSWQEVS
jgi:type II secretory pathway component PulK